MAAIDRNAATEWRVSGSNPSRIKVRAGPRRVARTDSPTAPRAMLATVIPSWVAAMLRSSLPLAAATARARRAPCWTSSSTRVMRIATSEYSATTKNALTAMSTGMAISPNRITAGPLGRACSLAPRRAVPRQPGEHFLVPVLAVLRLEHPVPLVREVDELRRDVLPLQGVE